MAESVLPPTPPPPPPSPQRTGFTLPYKLSISPPTPPRPRHHWAELLVLGEPQGPDCCDVPMVTPLTQATSYALLLCPSFGTQGLAGGFCPKMLLAQFLPLRLTCPQPGSDGRALLRHCFLSLQKPLLNAGNQGDVFRTLKKISQTWGISKF